MTMDKDFLPRSDDCFVCGIKNPHGLKLEFFAQENEVRAEFKSEPEKSGFKGIMHGGIITAILDEVMGWAPALAKKRMCMAAEITIRFVKPVPIGTELIAIGKFSQDRKRIWEAEGILTDKNQNIYSRASGKYIPLSDDETRKIDGYLLYRDGKQSFFLK